MIDVHPRDRARNEGWRQLRGLRYVFEDTVRALAQQARSPGANDQDVGTAVVVEVAEGGADRRRVGARKRRPRAEAARVVQEQARPGLAGGQHIEVTIAIDVEEG